MLSVMESPRDVQGEDVNLTVGFLFFRWRVIIATGETMMISRSSLCDSGGNFWGKPPPSIRFRRQEMMWKGDVDVDVNRVVTSFSALVRR